MEGMFVPRHNRFNIRERNVEGKEGNRGSRLGKAAKEGIQRQGEY